MRFSSRSTCSSEMASTLRPCAYFAAISPVILPHTMHSEVELAPSLFAPCVLLHAASPAAHRPAISVAPSMLVWMPPIMRSEEHTSELQSRENLVCRLLLEKKN